MHACTQTRTYKMDLWGRVGCYRDIFYFHGMPTDSTYVSGNFRQTSKGDKAGESLKQLIAKLWKLSEDYYQAKWACKDYAAPHSCRNTVPFNSTSLTLQDWVLDEARRNETLVLLRRHEAVLRAAAHNHTGGAQ